MNRSTRFIPPCPSPTPGVHPNPCPSSWWCHPTISSSVVPFSSCPQSFPASGSFQMIQLFSSGGQTIGVSASTSVLPMNTQDCFRMYWLDLLAVCGTLKSFLQHHISKASILWHSAFFTWSLGICKFKVRLKTTWTVKIKLQKLCNCVFVSSENSHYISWFCEVSNLISVIFENKIYPFN